MSSYDTSDSDIRIAVRSHLARHQIDTQRLRWRVFGGTVHMSGEVRRRGGRDLPACAGLLESLEWDVRRIPGVRRAQFEFDDWNRDGGGGWRSLEAERSDAEPEVVELPVLSFDAPEDDGE